MGYTPKPGVPEKVRNAASALAKMGKDKPAPKRAQNPDHYKRLADLRRAKAKAKELK